jgi:hypothetical protein
MPLSTAKNFPRMTGSKAAVVVQTVTNRDSATGHPDYDEK